MEIATSNGVEGVTVTSEEAKPGGKLGKDEFLSLLITQMQNQDPLDPMNSQETIAQLAQFSALEQMQNVNTQVGLLRQESGLLQSTFMEGRTITAQTKGGLEVSGIVEKVLWGEEGMSLQVDGETYPVKDLVSVSLVESEPESAG